jgi:hypothetical protein
LAALCRANPENTKDRPTYELEVGSYEESLQVELAFRDLIGDRFITYYHATRLLPHEEQMFCDDGLLVLSDALRHHRLDLVIERYGDAIGVERLDSLRHSGPAARDSSQRSGRVGLLHGLTPLAAISYAGWGMQILMTYWGGESFYFWSKADPEQSAAIAALSDLSTPTIIEVAARAQDLCTYHRLWPIFVGQIGHWDDPWHEFSTKVSIPPERVLDVLRPGSGRWPPMHPRGPSDVL